jgi:streptomycin 3"-adenylyltransferase
MNYNKILDEISYEYNKILGDNIVGIYVHGSIAFGCFNWDKSDIDFLVVTKEIPSQQEKVAMIRILLNLENISPAKGLEMSVVLEKYCQDFIYPTPFELHFSNAHIEKCKNNLDKYCEKMNGSDKDLAAHFIVIKTVGIVLCGKDIASVFGDIPKSDYIDSIKSDIESAENDIDENPVYIILNLCRVLAFVQDALVVSKDQGGLWGIKKLPAIYTPIIEAAIRSYCSNELFSADVILAKAFTKYMIEQIFKHDACEIADAE